MKLSMKNTFWKWLAEPHGPSGTCAFLSDRDDAVPGKRRFCTIIGGCLVIQYDWALLGKLS
jgi:hypothetical protein